ncbi:Uncharacterized protein Adt_44473 [Abeliophyllum distichum]|uniref:Uncharacterized protein n=1 Tax=Abeliophyllum distichum TaxID=126358 RepID=A0ABD1PAZ5_9LAMI
MEGVLSIRGVDGSTGETIPIDATPSLRGANDPYRADVVRWAALDVPSIMVEEDLTKLMEAYRIPADIELILPGPNERACFPMRGCTALHLNAFVSGMHLSLHLMLRRILRAYDLAPTQPRKLPRKKGREEEAGWYYFCPWGSHKPLVTGCPSSIKQWKESWFWVSGGPEDPELRIDFEQILLSGRAQLDGLQRKASSANACSLDEDISQRKVIEDLSKEGNKEAVEASKVIDVDDTPEGEVPLSRKRKARASRIGTSQARRSAVQVVDNYTVCSTPPLQRTLAVNTLGRWSSRAPPGRLRPREAEMEGHMTRRGG